MGSSWFYDIAMAAARLVGLWALSGCGGSSRAASLDAAILVPVSVAIAERRDVPIFKAGLGTVIPTETVVVHTQVDGVLQEVHFTEGQEVKPGDLLAVVDPRPFEAQLKQARGALLRDEALLEDNRINLLRNENLFRRHLIAKEAVDDQRAQVGQYLGATQIDRGQIEAARLNVQYAHIVSPTHGVTGFRLVDPGNVVHPSDPNGIVVITRLEPINVVFTLPQDDLPAVAAAMKAGPVDVELFSRDGTARLGQGRVLLVDNQINTTTATVRIKAVAPNPNRLLWPNLFVRAHARVATRIGATVIPTSAIQRGPQGPLVFVVNAGETVTARPVEVDISQGELTIIKSGLTPGETVVTEGQAQLGPNARVAIRESGADGGAAPDAGAARPPGTPGGEGR